jgi:hypothetical protein
VDYEKWASGLYKDELIGQAVIVEGYISKYPTTGAITANVGVFGIPNSPKIRVYVSQYSNDDLKQKSMRGGGNAHQLALDMTFRMVPVLAPLSMRDQIYALTNQQKVKVYGVVKQTKVGFGLGARIIRKRMSTMLPIFVEADRIEIAQK